MNRQMCSVIHLFSTGLVFVFVFVAIPARAKLGKVIFGVNAGGESHTDVCIYLTYISGIISQKFTNISQKSALFTTGCKQVNLPG